MTLQEFKVWFDKHSDVELPTKRQWETIKYYISKLDVSDPEVYAWYPSYYPISYYGSGTTSSAYSISTISAIPSITEELANLGTVDTGTKSNLI